MGSQQKTEKYAKCGASHGRSSGPRSAIRSLASDGAHSGRQARTEGECDQAACGGAYDQIEVVGDAHLMVGLDLRQDSSGEQALQPAPVERQDL
jgi:hypothetical protein